MNAISLNSHLGLKYTLSCFTTIMLQLKMSSFIYHLCWTKCCFPNNSDYAWCPLPLFLFSFLFRFFSFFVSFLFRFCWFSSDVALFCNRRLFRHLMADLWSLAGSMKFRQMLVGRQQERNTVWLNWGHVIFLA